MERVSLTQLREEMVLLERTLWITFQRDSLSRAFAGLSVSGNQPIYLVESATELSRLTCKQLLSLDHPAINPRGLDIDGKTERARDRYPLLCK